MNLKDKLKNIFQNKKKLIIGLVVLFLVLSSLVMKGLNQSDFKITGNNIHRRIYHTASILPNGKVLVAGGLDDDGTSAPTATAEIYDPKTGKFTETGDMIVPRIHPQSVLLKNGKVLIVDGVAEYPQYKDDRNVAELYDYKTGKFTRTGDVNIPRWDEFTVTLLNNGKVLITGGFGYEANVKMDKCEIYDPKTGKFKLISPMKYTRWGDTATWLKNGNVLIVGGGTPIRNKASLNNTEIFNPKTEIFTLGPVLHTQRGDHCSILLNNGNVLVVGGDNVHLYKKGTVEIYDTLKNKFTKMIKMDSLHTDSSLNTLSDGNVLIIGADPTERDKSKIKLPEIIKFFIPRIKPSKYEEIYNPKTNELIKIKNIGYSRGYHTATTLQDGRILIVGGAAYPRLSVSNLIFNYKGEK